MAFNYQKGLDVLPVCSYLRFCLWRCVDFGVTNVAELFGLSSHDAIFGAIFFSDSVGAAIGTIWGGRIFDITGSYQSAFLACVALSIMSIILVVFLSPITGVRRGR